MTTTEWFGAHLEVLGFAIGIMGVVLAVHYGGQARRSTRKTLDYEVVSDQIIVAARTGSSLTVKWNDRTLTNPRLIVLRVMNSGSREILPSDFEKPVTISVPGSTLIEGTVTASAAGDYSPRAKDDVRRNALGILNPTIDAPDSNVTIESLTFSPQLLNPRDWFELQLVVDTPECDDAHKDARARPEIDTRFAGQTRLPDMWVRESASWSSFFMAGFPALIFSVFFLYSLVHAVLNFQEPTNWLATVLSGLMAVLCIWLQFAFFRGRIARRYKAKERFKANSSLSNS